MKVTGCNQRLRPTGIPIGKPIKQMNSAHSKLGGIFLFDYISFGSLGTNSG